MAFFAWILNLFQTCFPRKRQQPTDAAREARERFNASLQVRKLEPRRVLDGTFAADAAALDLSGFTESGADNENLTITDDGTNYQFTLAEGVWSGDDAQLSGGTGNGLTTLTIAKNVVDNLGTGVNIDGNAGLLELMFGDADFSALGGTLNIDNASAVTQNAGTGLQVTTIEIDATSVDLSNTTTNDFDTFSATTTGNVSIRDTDNVTIAGVNTGGNRFTINTGAGLTDQTGAIQAGGLEVISTGAVDFLTGGAANDFDTFAANVAGVLQIQDSDGFVLDMVGATSDVTAAAGFGIISGGAVTQAGANGEIIAPTQTLGLQGAGSFTLTQAGNDVAILTTPSTVTGAISYTDANDLSVTDVSTQNSSIDIRTIDGNLTVAAANDIDAGNSTANLFAGTTGGTARTLVINAGANIAASGGVTLVGNNMNILGTVNAGTSTVNIRADDANTLIEIGGASADADAAVDTLGLSASELANITGNLSIGDATSGNISFNGTINRTGETVTLTTGGSIISQSPAVTDDIVAATLSLNAGNNIGAVANSLEVSGVTNLTFSAGGNVFIDGDGTTALGTVTIDPTSSGGASTYSLSNFSNITNFTATSDGTDLFLDQVNVSGALTIASAANNVVVNGGTTTLNADLTVTTPGDITIGDNMGPANEDAFLFNTGGLTLTLIADNDNNGAGAIIDGGDVINFDTNGGSLRMLAASGIGAAAASIELRGTAGTANVAGVTDTSGDIRLNMSGGATLNVTSAGGTNGLTTVGGVIELDNTANISSSASGTITTTAALNSGTASGAIDIDTTGTGTVVLAGAIITTGASKNAAAGSDGGQVNIDTVDGTIAVAAITTSGGISTHAGSNGGNAATVTLNTGNANVITLAGDISANGGANGGGGGVNGNGALVTISDGAQVGANSVTVSTQGNTGGDITFAGTISGDATTDRSLTLDAVGTANGGDIIFGAVTNSGGSFLGAFAASTSGGGKINLDHNISTDINTAGAGVTLAGRVEIGADVVIDTDQGTGADVGGAIDLSAATVFADGNNIDLDLNTSATTTGGAVSLGTFDNTGGSGFLNTLDVNTSAITADVTTLNGGIQLSDNTTATASALNFTGGGDVIISNTLVLNLSSATNGTQAGSINFGGSTISADAAAGFDLTINTSQTDATAGDDGSDGGNVGNLTAITRDGRERLRSVVINMNAADGADADGTLSFSGTTPVIETLASFGAATNGIEILGHVTVPGGGSLTLDTNPTNTGLLFSGAVDLDSALIDGGGQLNVDTSGGATAVHAGEVRLGDIGTSTRLTGVSVDTRGATTNGVLNIVDPNGDGTVKILVTIGNVDVSNVAAVILNDNTIIDSNPTAANQGNVLFQQVGGTLSGDIAGRELTIDVRGTTTGIDDDGDITLPGSIGSAANPFGSLTVLADEGTITIGNDGAGTPLATINLTQTNGTHAIQHGSSTVLTGNTTINTAGGIADFSDTIFSSDNVAARSLTINTTDGTAAAEGNIFFAGADNAGGNFLAALTFTVSESNGDDGDITFINDSATTVSVQLDGGNVTSNGTSAGGARILIADNTIIDTESGDNSAAGHIDFNDTRIDQDGSLAIGFSTLAFNTNGAGGSDGNIDFGNIGATRRLGQFAAIADSGTITINGPVILTTAVGAQNGDVTLGSFTQLTHDTSINTAGGNVNMQSTNVFSSAAGPFDLDINSVGGNVRLRNFTNTDGNIVGTFVNNVTVNTGGGFLELNGIINLDFDAVNDAEAASFSLIGTTNIDVRVAANSRIDTEQNDDQLAGLINLGTGNISGSVANRTLALDARGLAGSTGGEISFGPVTNSGGGSFLAAFSAATQGAAATTGKINFDNNITTDDPGNVLGAASGVTFIGRVEVLGSQQIVTQQGNDNNAGFVDLRNATLFAEVAGATNLTINTLVTGITNAGNVDLGVFNNGGASSFLDNVSITATADAGSTPGTLTVNAGVALDGNFDYRGGTANFNNGAASFITTNGTGFIEIEATSGATSDITMTDGSAVTTNNARITLRANDGVALSQVTAGMGNVAIVTADVDNNGNGAITDILVAETANITAGSAALRAGDGIGTDADDIDSAISGGATFTLAAATDSGDINVRNVGSLTIGTVDTLVGVRVLDNLANDSGNDNITVTASSPLTVNAAVVNADGGNIVLAANGSTMNDDADVNANITASGGNGDITLYAGDSIDVDASVTINASGTGDVTLAAGTNFNNGGGLMNGNAAGNLVMGDGSIVSSQGGTIVLVAPGNVLLSIVNANSDGTGTVGDVAIHADFMGVLTGLSDNIGAISDNLTGEAANITGDELVLTAGSGIGDGVAPADTDIDTAVNTLGAVSESGDIHIQNTGGLTIANVNISTPALSPLAGIGANGVTILDNLANDSGNDDITIRASSPLIVNAAVVNNDGGDIVLAAEGSTNTMAGVFNAADDDLQINTNVTATGGDGNVELLAGGDILQTTGTISAVGSGTVTVIAGENFNGGTRQNGNGNASFLMSDPAIINSEDGNITLRASGSIALARVNADTDADAVTANLDTNSTVFVTADFDGVVGGLADGNGRITDNRTTDEAANITALGAALRAGSGVGDGVAGTDDIDTASTNSQTFTLAAATDSGDINVRNVGSFTIDTVNTLVGVTILDTADNNSGNDDITLIAASPEIVNAPIDNRDGGDITLTALGTAATDDVTINADVQVTGNVAGTANDGRITVVAAADIIHNSGTVSTIGGDAATTSGQITYDAEETIRIGDATTGNAAAIVRTAAGNIVMTADPTAPNTPNATAITFSDAANTPANEVLVETVSGNITIDGTATDVPAGTTSGNRGVLINSGSVVRSTGMGAGLGSITITGTGGNGINENDGVRLDGAGTRVASVDGDVTIVGTGNGTGTSNRGVEITGTAQVNITGTADVIVNGTAGANTAEGVLITGGAIIGDVNAAANPQDATGFIILDANTGELEINGSTVRTNAPANATRRILLSADTIDLVNSLVQINSLGAGATLGQGEIVAAPDTGTVNVNLGAGAAAGFALTDVELNQLDARIVRIGSANILAPGNTPMILNQNNASVIGGTLSQPFATGTQSTITVTGAFTPDAAFATDLFQLRTRDTANAATTDNIAINGNLNLQTNNPGRHFEAYAGLDITQGNSADVTTGSAAGQDDKALVDIAVRDGDVRYRAERLINMTAGTSITTINGEVTLSANQQAVPTVGDFTGITLTTAAISTGVVGTNPGGLITLSGRGGSTGATSNNRGVLLQAASTITSNGTDDAANGRMAGTIDIDGEGGAGEDFNEGVRITGAGTQVTSADGNITIDGTGQQKDNAGSEDSNRGVLINGGAVVSSTGDDSNNLAMRTAADITISGTGANGDDDNDGVEIDGTMTRVTTNDGNITITGNGGSNKSADSNQNRGVQISNAAVVSSTGTDDTANGQTAGTITINGIGGAGEDDNDGVFITDAGTRVTSADGDITIDGTGQRTAIVGVTEDSNRGVRIDTGAVVSSTGTDTNDAAMRTASLITISGTGAAGDNNNDGVEIDGAAVTSIDGNISIQGIGGGTGDNNHGVELGAGANIQSLGTTAQAANITIDGTGSGVNDSEGVLITGNTTATFTNNTPVPIPDNGTATSQIVVPGGFRVDDLDVTINITHTFDADLVVTIISPNGTRIPLVSRTGGGGNNFTNTVFDDETATPIITGAAPFTGTFRPVTPLSNFDGENADGIWTLEISDNAGADVGTLNSWTLNFDVATSVSSVAGNIDIDGTSMASGMQNEGVELSGGAFVGSTMGNITLDGTGNGTNGDNEGVLLTGGNTRLANNSGNITVNGTSTGGGNQNEGVEVSAGALVSNTAGTIGITGTGSGVSDSEGVLITGMDTQITGGNSVTINGSTTATTNDNTGVEVSDLANINALDGLNIIGTGNGSGDRNHGVEINNATIAASTITNGQLNVTGTGAAGLDNNVGVLITNNATVNGQLANLTLTQEMGGAVFTPNVLTFSFPVPANLNQPAVLTFNANADLNLASEFLALNVEGILTQNLFVNGGLQSSPSTTMVNLTAAQVATLAADGFITLTITPSADVNNLSSPTELSVTLAVPNAAVDAPININGTALGTGDNNKGVEISAGSTVMTTNANINIDGTGSGTDSSEGIQVEGAGTMVTAVDGDIAITGRTTGTGDSNKGIEVQDGAVVSSTGMGAGAGTITINGSGSGNDQNEGVQIESIGTLITSVDGNIIITGISNGVGAGNEGVEILAGAVVSSTGIGPGAATITISGLDNDNTNADFGVLIDGAATRVMSNEGVININAAGLNNMGGNLQMDNGSQITSNTGDIHLRSTNDVQLGRVTTGSNVFVTADAMVSIPIPNNAVLQPAAGATLINPGPNQNPAPPSGPMLPAGTIFVTTTADVVDAADGVLSLREAILAANANPGPDTISLAAGTYTLAIVGIGEDAAATGDLDITDDLTLVGATGDAADVIIDAAGIDRVFQILGSINVEMSGVTIQHGDAPVFDFLGGGGIHNNGTLTLDGVAVIDNNTRRSGGGIFNNGGALTITNSTLSNNTASSNGGGIFNVSGAGVLTITDSTFSGNSAGTGGALRSDGGNLTITNSILDGNQASNSGGGFFGFNNSFTITDSSISNNTGGGIQYTLGNGSSGTISNSVINGNSVRSGLSVGGFFGAALTITDSTVNDNVSQGSGGGMSLSVETTITNSIISGNQANFSGGGIRQSRMLTITGSTISGNTAGGDGGGIAAFGEVTVFNSIISSNTGSDGGAIFQEGSSVTLTGSTLSGNTANGDGGAIANCTGTVILMDSTVSGNTAGGDGGGLFNDDDMTIINSTVSGNTAGGDGGGIFNDRTLDLDHVTITNNTADGDNSGTGDAGGIFNRVGRTVNFHSTIVAGNTDTGGEAPDVAGVLNSQGFSLIQDTSGTTIIGNLTGNIIGQNPQLGPLTDNGGPTQTHALSTGSPAIDAADLSDFPATDQRGLTRLQGAGPDTGAFEVQVIVAGSIDVQPDGVGAIVDNLAAEDQAGINITAAAASLRAGSGVGNGVNTLTTTDTDDIDTQVGTLASLNTTAGDINVENFGGQLLTIGTVNGTVGVTNNAPGGNISVTNNSPLTIAADVTNNSGGNITITANAPGDLGIAGNVMVNGGGGDIVLNGGTNVNFLTGGNTISTDTVGSIIDINAFNGDVTGDFRDLNSTTTIQTPDGIARRGKPAINLASIVVPQIDVLGFTSLTVNIGVAGETNLEWTIDWGDGVVDVFIVDAGTQFATHTYLASPNANQADPINILFQVEHVDSIRVDGFISTTIVDFTIESAPTQAETPGTGFGATVFEFDSNAPALSFPETAAATGLDVLSETSTLEETTSNVQIIVSDSTAAKDESFELRLILRSGKEEKFPLDNDILEGDNIKQLWKRLPDGRYQIVLIRRNIKRVVLTVDVRGGRAFNRSDATPNQSDSNDKGNGQQQQQQNNNGTGEAKQNDGDEPSNQMSSVDEQNRPLPQPNSETKPVDAAVTLPKAAESEAMTESQDDRDDEPIGTKVISVTAGRRPAVSAAALVGSAIAYRSLRRGSSAQSSWEECVEYALETSGKRPLGRAARFRRQMLRS